MPIQPGEDLAAYQARLQNQAAARAAPASPDARFLDAAQYRAARAEAIRHRPQAAPLVVAGGRLARDLSPAEYGAALASMGYRPRRF